MAYPISRSTWSREKVDSSNINNGNEYIVDDDVSLEQLNAIVNNSLYASDTADTALDNSNQAIETAKSALSQVVEKQGTVVTLEGEALSTWSADFAESERQKSETDGAIVHENTLKNSLINSNTNNTPDLSNCSTYDEVFNALLTSKNGKGYGSIGKQDGTSNFKSLLPAQPSEFANYTTVIAEIKRDSSDVGFIQFFAEAGASVNAPIYYLDVHRLGNGTWVVSGWYKPEVIETIYDMSSTDSNINWGQTSGITGGVTISDKDFSKYKELEVYACLNISLVKFTIDLTQSIIGLNTDFDYYYISGAKVSPIDSYYSSMSTICYVNPEKTSFCHHAVGYDNNAATFNERNNNDSYVVYKIKGVY